MIVDSLKMICVLQGTTRSNYYAENYQRPPYRAPEVVNRYTDCDTNDNFLTVCTTRLKVKIDGTNGCSERNLQLQAITITIHTRSRFFLRRSKIGVSSYSKKLGTSTSFLLFLGFIPKGGDFPGTSPKYWDHERVQ